MILELYNQQEDGSLKHLATIGGCFEFHFFKEEQKLFVYSVSGIQNYPCVKIKYNNSGNIVHAINCKTNKLE